MLFKTVQEYKYTYLLADLEKNLTVQKALVLSLSNIGRFS